MSDDLLRDLMDAGTPTDLVVRVAQLLGEVKTTRERKAADAERKRKERAARPRTSTEISDVQDVQDAASAPSSLSTLPECSSSDSEEERKEEACGSGRARSKPSAKSRKGTRLSADWRPTSADDAWAADLLGPAFAGAELAKFKDWWAAKAGAGGVKLDWDATWRNWIRRAAEQRGSNGGSGQTRGGAAGGSHKPPSGSFLAGMAAVLAERPDSRLYRGDPGGRGQGQNGRSDDRKEPLTLDIGPGGYREASG